MPQHDRPTRPPIGATVLGYPHTGRDGQLEQALESYRAARSAQADHAGERAEELRAVARRIRVDALETMQRAGIDSVPVNTFSFSDQMLDTALMLGVVPERFRGIRGVHRVGHVDADQYFAMARGDGRSAPLERTRWFDTDCHHLVPEIDADTPFALDAAKPIAEHREATTLGLRARPVIIGPWTFLRLATAAAGSPEGFVPLDRLEELTGFYVDLLARLSYAGVAWVQLDEPAAVSQLDAREVALLKRVYARLSAVTLRPAILVATYFGRPVEALPALAATGLEGLALDLVRGPTVEEVSGIRGLKDKALVLGAVDGRGMGRNDLDATLARLQEWQAVSSEVSVSSSCSLRHGPDDLSWDSSMDLRPRRSMAVVDQKLQEVVTLQRRLDPSLRALSVRQR